MKKKTFFSLLIIFIFCCYYNVDAAALIPYISTRDYADNTCLTSGVVNSGTVIPIDGDAEAPKFYYYILNMQDMIDDTTSCGISTRKVGYNSGDYPFASNLSISDTSIASIDANGNLEIHKPGTITISVADHSYEFTFFVTN